MDSIELRTTTLCGLTLAGTGSSLPDPNKFLTFEEVLEATCRSTHGVVGKTGAPGASEYQQVERSLLRSN